MVGELVVMDTYDFPAKAIYRARRLTAFDRLLKKHRKLRKVAYLDTAEALDTIAYLRQGYQAQHLWAINKSPAQVAALTMKLKTLKLPLVNTVGLDFLKAIETRVPLLDIIDFDGMSNASDRLVNELAEVMTQQGSAVYGITVLAGRENIEIFEAQQGWKESIDRRGKLANHSSFGTVINQNHVGRFSSFINTLTANAGPLGSNQNDCYFHVTKLIWDAYRSTSGQTMLWAALKIEHHKHLSHDDIYLLAKNTSGISVPLCILNRFS